jgi:hypothetical protein
MLLPNISCVDKKKNPTCRRSSNKNSIVLAKLMMTPEFKKATEEKKEIMLLKTMCGPNKWGHPFICCDKNDPEMQKPLYQNRSNLGKIIKDDKGDWLEIVSCNCSGDDQRIADCEKKYCKNLDPLPPISIYDHCKYYTNSKSKGINFQETTKFQEIKPDCPNKLCDDSFFNTMAFYKNRKKILFGGTSFYIYSCCVCCFVIILLFFVMF